MSKISREQYFQSIKQRYSEAGKKRKAKILDEFTALTGYNRCYASCLLKIRKEKVLGYITIGGKRIKYVLGKKKKKTRDRVKIYGHDVFVALKKIWAPKF